MSTDFTMEVGNASIARGLAADAAAAPNLSEAESRPVGSSRVGVRRAVTKIAAFAALLVLMAYALDAFVTSGLRSVSTSKFGSMNRVITGRVNADIVINGSSRALTHYDPRIIEKITGRSAYNLGMNGIQTDLQLAILKTYLDHNRQPALIIQNLEAFTFETTRRGEIYDPGIYLPYLDEPNIYSALSEIDRGVWKWKHVPMYGYVVEDMRFTWIAGIMGRFGISGHEDYFQGFNPRAATWSEDFERFRATVPHGVRYAIEPAGVRALSDLIRLCRARGIRLILVYSPEYAGMQALENNRGRIFAQFEELSRRFDVPLWDYSNSELCLNTANFYNSQHLNANGAAAFTLDLAHRLVGSSEVAPARAKVARGDDPRH